MHHITRFALLPLAASLFLLQACSHTPTPPAAPSPAPSQAPTEPRILSPEGSWLSEDGVHLAISEDGEVVRQGDALLEPRPMNAVKTPQGQLSWTQERQDGMGKETYTVLRVTPTQMETLCQRGEKEASHIWVRTDNQEARHSYTDQSLVGLWEGGVSDMVQIALVEGKAQVVRDFTELPKSESEVLETGRDQDGVFFWTSRITSWDANFAEPSKEPFTSKVVAQNKNAILLELADSRLYVMTRRLEP